MSERFIPIPGGLLKALVLLAILFGLVEAAWAAQSKRVALVVGNAAYADRPLANPVNDARLMQTSLRELGFEVQVATNVDRRGLLAALRTFESNAREADVAVFFFAGHGAQVGGNNYLIPVNAPIGSVNDLRDEAVDAASVLIRLEDARARVTLVILDACRDNPFPGSHRSAARGLAKMNAPVGTIVAYATGPDSTADDGTGSNGVYTGALARHLKTPGLDIKEVFNRTAQEVERVTQGRQRPREDVGLRSQLILRDAGGLAVAAVVPQGQPPVPQPQSAPAPSGAEVESQFWADAKAINNREAYEAYLAEHPTGRYAALARAAIRRLGATAVAGGGRFGSAGPSTTAQAVPAHPAPATQASGASAPIVSAISPLSNRVDPGSKAAMGETVEIGPLFLRSALGEPLDAEIPVRGVGAMILTPSLNIGADRERWGGGRPRNGDLGVGVIQGSVPGERMLKIRSIVPVTRSRFPITVRIDTQSVSEAVVYEISLDPPSAVRQNLPIPGVRIFRMGGVSAPNLPIEPDPARSSPPSCDEEPDPVAVLRARALSGEAIDSIWARQVRERVRANISGYVDRDNPMAEFVLLMNPIATLNPATNLCECGFIVNSVRLIRPSGKVAWDMTAERGLLKSNPWPLKLDGTCPSGQVVLSISHK